MYGLSSIYYTPKYNQNVEILLSFTYREKEMTSLIVSSN